MSESVGVAINGTGMWGRRLATTVQQTPSLKLVTCYSRNEEKRTRFAAQFDCRSAASFSAAI